MLRHGVLAGHVMLTVYFDGLAHQKVLGAFYTLKMGSNQGHQAHGPIQFEPAPKYSVRHKCDVINHFRGSFWGLHSRLLHHIDGSYCLADFPNA